MSGPRTRGNHRPERKSPTALADHRDRLARVETYCRLSATAFVGVGGIALAVLLGVTVAEVFWRYVMNGSLIWIEDLSTMSLAVVVAGAVAYGAGEGSHVCVNLIVRFWGRPVTRITDAAARLLGVAATATAAYAVFAHGSCGLACGAATRNVSIPHKPFYYVLGASLAAYGLLLATQLLRGLAAWKGEDPNEPAE